MAQAVSAPVLVVDDNAETRELMMRVLSICGYDVTTARDGLDALLYFRSGGRASAIVLDLAMPNMDGIALRRALSADPRWASIPVVVFSAFTERARAEPGIFGIVTKGSADVEALLSLVARAVDQPGN